MKKRWTNMLNFQTCSIILVHIFLTIEFSSANKILQNRCKVLYGTWIPVPARIMSHLRSSKHSSHLTSITKLFRLIELTSAVRKGGCRNKILIKSMSAIHNNIWCLILFNLFNHIIIYSVVNLWQHLLNKWEVLTSNSLSLGDLVSCPWSLDSEFGY